MAAKIFIWLIRFIWGNLWMWGVFFLSLLPHPKVKKGDRFLVLEDIKTSALTHWKAPATFGFNCTIPKGTILVTEIDGARISRGFACSPENYEEFEEAFVPESDRKNPKYNGYSFAMKYSDIGKRLKKL